MGRSMDMEEQYDKIYRYCYFRLHDRQTAEDITQETFLRYLEKYQDTVRTPALGCKYLYTIARNLCIDEYRRCARDPLGEDKRVSEEPETALPQETSEEERILTSLAVRAAVAALGQDEQELLLLRYVNEVPVLTIAQLMGISRFAVHRKLTAVSKKFRKALKEEGF